MARTARTNLSLSPKSTGFDISSRYMAETVDVEIMDPEDATVHTGMVWTIGSQHSKEAKQAMFSATKLTLNKKGEVEASAGVFDDTLLEQLVAVSRGWTGANVNGEPLPHTPENVRSLLTDPRTAWMRPQVQNAFLSLSGFFSHAKAS